jgi:hypothetical protein
MKVGKVRVGEKFVLDDRGGVWEKISDEGTEPGCKVVTARCFFGNPENFGKTIQIDPMAFCYVMFENRPKPFGRDAAPATPGTTRVFIADDMSGDVIKEIFNPTPGQLTAFSSSDTIRFVPPGKRRIRVFHVSEFAYDVDEDAFYLLVMPEREVGKDDGNNIDSSK